MYDRFLVLSCKAMLREADHVFLALVLGVVGVVLGMLLLVAVAGVGGLAAGGATFLFLAYV